MSQMDQVLPSRLMDMHPYGHIFHMHPYIAPGVGTAGTRCGSCRGHGGGSLVSSCALLTQSKNQQSSLRNCVVPKRE